MAKQALTTAALACVLARELWLLVATLVPLSWYGCGTLFPPPPPPFRSPFFFFVLLIIIAKTGHKQDLRDDRGRCAAAPPVPPPPPRGFPASPKEALGVCLPPPPNTTPVLANPQRSLRVLLRRWASAPASSTFCRRAEWRNW